jgi:hypothetical protein
MCWYIIHSTLCESVVPHFSHNSLRPRSLNGLVKMQATARSSQHEPVSATPVRRLRGCSVSGSKPGHATPMRSIRLSHGFAKIVHCPSLHETLWLEKTSGRFEPCALYKMAPHCCLYQSGARMLSRPCAMADLEAVPREPRSLVRCRFSRFVALWIWGFAFLG